jgi:HAD superfamily hydrolase (TIGR01509 family)
MMPSIHGLIYDCDGVLFESKKANLAFYNAVLDNFGEPSVPEGTAELLHLCHTAASPAVLERLLGGNRLGAALSFASTLGYQQFIHHMIPEPGVVQALQTLSDRMPLAVATNRGGSMLEVLDHFDLRRYFQVVVTSWDVPRPKPAPDMLFLAAERMGLREKNLLFMGDSELDREAAKGAGIRFAGYKWQAHGEIEISAHSQLVEILGGD